MIIRSVGIWSLWQKLPTMPLRYLHAQPFPFTFIAVNFGCMISMHREHDFGKQDFLITIRRNRVHDRPKSCSRSAEISVHVGPKYALSDGAIDHVAAYKPFHCLQKAERLYAAYRKAAARNIGPGEEYDLVDEFATQLGVRAWYVWRPDVGPGQDATPQVTADAAPARDPAPARRIDSPAALMFLVSALDRLKNLSDAEVKSIAAETALKGTTGIDLDSPAKIHSISALGNERLSGLELICLMHAAFQRIHAGTDVGVDFSHIWPAAQMMHAARNP